MQMDIVMRETVSGPALRAVTDHLSDIAIMSAAEDVRLQMLFAA